MSPGGTAENGVCISNRFPVAPPGLDRCWNADPQLKLRAIVCRLCEAEIPQRRRRGIFVVLTFREIRSSVSDIGGRAGE